MDSSRRQWVVGAVLVVLGAALWVVVVRPLIGPMERDWNVQIGNDALALMNAVRYDLRLEGEEKAKFDAAWEKRRALYDEAHLAKLRDRLTTFLDFEVAEYADAKNSYLSGRVPEKPSTQALVAQEKLKEAFGAAADDMLKQYKDKVREQAYRASPAIGGKDPEAAKYDAIYDDLVANWLPEARATIERLTAPTR